MKKLGFLLVAVLFLWSCDNSPQGMAEKSVKKYLKKDVPGYQSVSFGQLDTLQLSKILDYVEVRDSLRFYMDALKETGDQFKLAENQKNASRLRHIKKDMEEFYANKKFIINHTFQGKAEDGSVQDMDADFFLDSMYRVIE